MIEHEEDAGHHSWPFFSIANAYPEFLDRQVEEYQFPMEADEGIDIVHHEFSAPFNFTPTTTTTTSSHDSYNLEMNRVFYNPDDEVEVDLINIPVPAHRDDELDFTLPDTDDFFPIDLEEFEPRCGIPSNLDSESRIEPPFVDLHRKNYHLSPKIQEEDDEYGSGQLLILPEESMDVDHGLAIIHLVIAYGEAVNRGETELTEVIVNRINDKVSPVGDILQRLLYHLFQRLHKQSEYLAQESVKNFHAALKAFYLMFPYGKFAHLAANSAILESLPQGAKILHIYDFDTGEGIQWSSMIESLSSCQQAIREIRLISIKWPWIIGHEEEEEEDYSNMNRSFRWRFEDTRRRLLDCAASSGLNLKVEEMELHDFVAANEIKKANTRECFAFNCMLALPHMQRLRNRGDAMKFLRKAQEILSNIASTDKDDMGIVAFGDGNPSLKRYRDPPCSSYGSFMDGHLVHYQALLESMELNFPIHLGEARTALECLFVAPFISSVSWIKKWEEADEWSHNIQTQFGFGFGFQDCKVTEDCLKEAKQMVREGDSLYSVRVEGDKNNSMILEWRGIPLVTSTCWRS